MRASSGGVRKTESVREGSTRVMTDLEIKRLKDERLITLRTAHRKLQERKNNMNETKSEDLQSEKNGVLSIQSDNSRPSAIGTVDNPQSSSDGLVVHSDIIGWESMRLIDSSVTHLHDKMRVSKTPVEAAICVDQMVKMLRLKLDVRKASK